MLWCWNVKMKNSNLNFLTWFILSINIAHSFFGFQVSFSDFPSKIWLQFLYYQNNSWLDSCLQSRTEVSEIFANNQTRKSTSESSLNKMELLQSQAPTKRELLGSLVVRTYWSLEIGRLIKKCGHWILEFGHGSLFWTSFNHFGASFKLLLSFS